MFLEPFAAGLVAVTVFFLTLGFLVLFIKEIEPRILLGVLLLLAGGLVGFFTAGIYEIGSIFAAIGSALTVNWVLEYFSVL